MKRIFTLCFLILTSLAAAGEIKKALIFGITGQDGAYLTEFLLEKGYEVHGVKRPASTLNTSRIDRFYKDLHEKNIKMILHYGDILDATSVFNLIHKIRPDEIYNLAAQSHVGVSFQLSDYTSQVNALGTLRILNAIKELGLKDKTRYYQASTSELYGLVQETPQSETTPFYPRSPYAVAKLYAYWITVNYREAYGLYACNGILFNHESPFRGATFVTKKITKAVANIHFGQQDVLYLGNLDAKRDWGYAKDYVEAMWMMLQQETASDFVIATGENHSVREFVELAFQEIGIDIVWQGEGVDEVGIDSKTKKILIRIDPAYFRPTEVDFLLGNPSKAKEQLGWKIKTSFKELVSLMVQSDLKQVKIASGNITK